MFSTSFHNKVIDPIPADLEPKSVTTFLHDHDGVIGLSPVVTRHEIRDRNPETGWIKYEVSETVPMLPFGLWKRSHTFHCSFKDKQDGVTTFVEAVMGINSEAIYTVRVSEGQDEGTGWVLDESIETSCNFLVKWVVQSNMLQVRKKMHQQLFDELRRRQKGSGKNGEVGDAPVENSS